MPGALPSNENLTMFITLAQHTEPTFWMPEGGSTFVDSHDALFYFILYVSLFFFILIGALMFFFAMYYRQKDRRVAADGPTHSTSLEVAWTVVPVVIVLVMFGWGLFSYMDMATPPENAYEVKVTARSWSWEFEYPNGVRSNVLHVPNERAIRLVLRSEDVIHSFYCPQFRIKKDAVPGRFNVTWFKPTVTNLEGRRTGELWHPNPTQIDSETGRRASFGSYDNAALFDVFCAEYCGTQHAIMRTYVVVHTPEGFNHWMQQRIREAETLPPAKLGELLFVRNGCNACHSVDGSSNRGPTLQNVYNNPQPIQMRDGRTRFADEQYLADSIRNPGLDIVLGYDNIMPRYDLPDRDIDALIAYIKYLSEHTPEDVRQELMREPEDEQEQENGEEEQDMDAAPDDGEDAAEDQPNT